MLQVWRQTLAENGKRVALDGKSCAVRRSANTRLAQIDFEVAGQPIRGLERNPNTKSLWAQLARKGAKVKQFLPKGRYLPAIADGEITHYSR